MAKVKAVSLTAEDIDELTGYANGESKVLARLNINVTLLEQLALDENVECCPTCDWWVDSHELLDDDQKIDGHCDNCRPVKDVDEDSPNEEE